MSVWRIRASRYTEPFHHTEYIKIACNQGLMFNKDNYFYFLIKDILKWN